MRRLIGILLVLALAAAACGGDDSDDAETSAGTEAADEAGEEATPDDSDNSGETDNGGSDESDAGSSSSGGDGSLCAMATDLAEDDPLSEVSIFEGERFFEVMNDAWDRVEDMAPDEIEDDVALIRDFFDEMEAAAAEADYDFSDPALGERLAELDTTGLDEASDRISAFFLDRCGIDLDASPDFGDDEAGSIEPPEAQDGAGIDPRRGEAAILAQIWGIDEELGGQCREYVCG